MTFFTFGMDSLIIIMNHYVVVHISFLAKKNCPTISLWCHGSIGKVRTSKSVFKVDYNAVINFLLND